MDLAGRFNAIQFWKIDIRQDHPRSKSASQCNQFLTIGSLPHDFDFWLGAEHSHQALPDHQMIISD
jgi:hypothetical protein